MNDFLKGIMFESAESRHSGFEFDHSKYLVKIANVA